jgi:hypothetical protein
MNSGNKAKRLSASKTASGRLCADLSRGIHAAAQPLSILRASLDRGYTDRMTEAELRDMVDSSAAEVERVCTLFNYLQQIVMVESIEPKIAALPIAPLLADAADGVNLLFEKDGMLLRAKAPADCPPVLIDKERTLHALSAVLLIAHTVSRARDTVDFVTSAFSRSVRVVVRNRNSNVLKMNAEAGLSMALADANIRSQHGDFSWSLQPFCVHIGLRRASFAPHD